VKLLRIDSSPMGEAAISRQLTMEFVQSWLKANPQSTVMKRDLTTTTIPVIDAAWVAANYTPKESRTHQQNELLKLSTLHSAGCAMGFGDFLTGRGKTY
jgi:FMN-dependent NADH-azoreductase